MQPLEPVESFVKAPGDLIELPRSLTNHFHDSSLELDSYAPDGAILALRIEKEIGPEVGLIRFHGVSFLSLPHDLPGDAIRGFPLSAASTALWVRHTLVRDYFNGDEVVYEIVSQEGPLHIVIAKDIDYEILDPG